MINTIKSKFELKSLPRCLIIRAVGDSQGKEGRCEDIGEEKEGSRVMDGDHVYSLVPM
jgi:hypothetical protein